MDPGGCWVKLSPQVSLGMSALHVKSLLIKKRHSNRSSKEEVIVVMEDNRAGILLVQTKEADKSKHLKLGENVLKLFLNIALRVKSAIIFSKQADKNSVHTAVSALGNKIMSRRVARNTVNVLHSISTSTSTSHMHR